MAKETLLIARWHGRVIEATTRLIAVATFDNSRFADGFNALHDDVFSFVDLERDADVEVIDVLHDFCFFLRKVVERADSVELAKALVPHGEREVRLLSPGRNDEKLVQLNGQSLWWWLGRVIHSKSLHILDGGLSKTVCYPNGHTRDFITSREYVVVSSDHDAADVEHVLHVPSLLRTYVSYGLRGRIERVVSEHR